MKRVNKITAWLIAAALMISMLTAGIGPVYAEEASPPAGQVTVSVEKFSLGQGYVREPVSVPLYEGENGASVLVRVLGNGQYDYTGSIDSAFYLAFVKDNDASAVNVPQPVLDAMSGDGIEMGGKADADWLGQFDYTFMSGWMYAVNGEFPGYGLSDYVPQDGDVMRMQFTLYGYGADLGGGWDGNLVEPAAKERLTELVGSVNSASGKAEMLADPAVGAAYAEAYAALENMMSAQTEVDEAYDGLAAALAEYESGAGKPEGMTPESHLRDSLDYLHASTPNPGFGTLGGDWTILTLARAGFEAADGYYDIYYNNVLSAVEQNMAQYGGKLDRNKGTEHSRLMLGLTAIGKDVTRVGEYDIRAALADFDYVKKQGINGPIFALLAFDSLGYGIPSAAEGKPQTTREALIRFILDKEIHKGTAEAGGWALGSSAADPDITAMALQALAAHYSSNNEVKSAADRAVAWLSKAQNGDGGFSTWGTANAESAAQVIVALTALGIDPHTDPRFVKNGSSVLDALMTYAVPGGGFKHVHSQSAPDAMASDQGTYALVAYDRFNKGLSPLFDMTDAGIPLPEEEERIEVPPSGDDFGIPIGAADGGKRLAVAIPEARTAGVYLELPSNAALPGIEIVKGGLSASFPQGARVVGGDASRLELIGTIDLSGAALRNAVTALVPAGSKLDGVAAAFAMGGAERIDFSDYVTLTFAGQAGKQAAYIQDGTAYAIAKYADDAAGLNSGKAEYAFDRGSDLIVRTKHFTDFAAYTASPDGTPGSGGGTEAPPSYVTLSVDKLTINRGYTIPAEQVPLQPGDTAWTVLKRALDAKGIGYDYVWIEKYGSVYVQSIDGDGEFDHGSGSGWMYSVNGTYPNYGASKYALQNGDTLQWRYTTNLGVDLGQDPSGWEQPVTGGGTGGAGGGSAEQEGSETEQDEAGSGDGDMGAGGGNDSAGSDAAVDLKKRYADAAAIAAWAEEAVARATGLGIVQGSGGKFHPTAPVTRAEFAKLLALVGKLDTERSGTGGFADIAPDKWYAPYVSAVAEAGWMQGDEGRFRPDAPITREQMAATIARVLKLPKVDEKNAEPLKDGGSVSAWAREAVNAVVSAGLMQGDNGSFRPKDAVTRQMAAVTAMRVHDARQGAGQDAGGDGPAESVGSDGAKGAGQDGRLAEVEALISDTAAFLTQTVTEPAVASVGGEWTVFALARSGEAVPEGYFDDYYAVVERTLKDKEGKLHRVKYTEYDRVILALTAIGKDIDNVAGYSLREPLADYETVVKQGINGPIFALIALDSAGYDIPAASGVETRTTRELLIDFILKREIAGGGWALDPEAGQADPDVTAMAIQGLTPYYEERADVRAAVDRGVGRLSELQEADGGYASWDSVNSESAAQVVVALTGLGIDPHTDPGFVKNGRSVLDALLAFAAPEGGFYHVMPGGTGNGGAAPGEVDLMATDQALYALVAYERFMNGVNRLYDLTDVMREEERQNVYETAA